MKPPSLRIAGAFPVDGDIGEPSDHLISSPGLFGGIGVSGLDPNIGPEAVTRQGEGPKQVDPGGGGGGPAAFCFEFYGLKWGKDYASVYNWAELSRMIRDRGYKRPNDSISRDPNDWACDHPVWADCIDAIYHCQTVEPTPPPPLEVEVSAGTPFGPVAGGVALGRSAIYASAPIAALAVRQVHLDGHLSTFKRFMNPDLDGEQSWTVPELHPPSDFEWSGGGGGGGAISFPQTNLLSFRLTDVFGRTKTGVRAATRALATTLAGYALCFAKIRVGAPKEVFRYKEPVTSVITLPPVGYLTSEVFVAFLDGSRIHNYRVEVFINDATGFPVASQVFVKPPGPPDYSMSLVLSKKTMSLEGVPTLGPALQRWSAVAHGYLDYSRPGLPGLQRCAIDRRSLSGPTLSAAEQYDIANYDTRRFIADGPLGVNVWSTSSGQA